MKPIHTLTRTGMIVDPLAGIDALIANMLISDTYQSTMFETPTIQGIIALTLKPEDEAVKIANAVRSVLLEHFDVAEVTSSVTILDSGKYTISLRIRVEDGGKQISVVQSLARNGGLSVELLGVS